MPVVFRASKPYEAPCADVGVLESLTVIMTSDNMFGAGSMGEGTDTSDNDFFN